MQFNFSLLDLDIDSRTHTYAAYLCNVWCADKESDTSLLHVAYDGIAKRVYLSVLGATLLG